jgi:hypothetical protein
MGRNEGAIAFFSVLFGCAFQEAVGAIRNSFQDPTRSAPPWGSEDYRSWDTVTVFYGVIFFFLALRFLVGNIIHMLHLPTDRRTGLWLYDFFTISSLSLCFIFMGFVTSHSESGKGLVTFVGWFYVLLVLDVCWMGLRHLSGVIRNVPEMKLSRYQWCWFLLNLATLALVWVVCSVWFGTWPWDAGPDRAHHRDLGFVAFLLGVNLIAFFIDVVITIRADANPAPAPAPPATMTLRFHLQPAPDQPPTGTGS